jgi:PAS domain S-box-containing protein
MCELGVESYVGRRLDGPDGTPIGHICVVYREALQDAELARSMLRIFAARAAAELQRELTEQKLREQASLLDKASDAILVRSIDHRILFWNRGAERLYGWAPEEAVGRHIDRLLYDNPGPFHDATRQVLEHGQWQGRIVQCHRDGRRIVVEAHWTLVRDAYGEPQSILAINTDISERIALEDKLQQSQRLEAIGQLTGGVAHDFNNLLTVIQGSAELLGEKLAADTRLLALADMIGKAAQKGADLTHRLLAVARRQALDPRAVDVNELVLGMTPLLQRTLPENVELSVETPPGLPAALVDPSELEGALLNLSLNARDAMPDGGKLTIETAEIRLDEDFARRNVDVTPGRYLMIAVSDTGCGIPQENIGRVFDPFFSTKEFGKGTGLGLSMVYGFIRQSRGHVRIYSEVGQGTSVRMYLPHAPAGISEAIEFDDDSEPSGSEHVLMVEDDDLVRRHVEHQLRELGYRVTAVSSGPAALECLERMDDIDLLFTDVIMPGGLNGPQLAAAARSMRPDLPVLYTSGYTENAIVHHGRLDAGVHLLNKPYRRKELARKIRQVLAAPPNDGAHHD